MSATAWLAYGHARVRARKARLLSSAVLAALATAERPDLTVEGWRDLRSDADAASLLALVYARLMADYDAVIHAYPFAGALLRALAGRHELENVKLAWRAVIARAEPARWRAWWRPMGPLETVCAPDASVTSLQQLVEALSHTSFERIAQSVLRAHGTDLAAIEMAFDRWGSDTLVQAARALPHAEHLARDLVALVVCERDVAVFERAVGLLGVRSHVAIRMTAMLAEVLGPAAIRQVAHWSPDGGVPMVVSRRLSAHRPSVRSFDELRAAIQASRRAACRRVFRSHPFCMAPSVALVLMREDETRALISIGELRARHAPAADAARVLGRDG